MIGLVKGLEAADFVPFIGFTWKSASPVCPAEFYTGTTWKQIKDVAIMAAGDIYQAGSTGGSATHTLTVDEMPAHTHVGSTSSDGGHYHTANTTVNVSGSSFESGQNGEPTQTKTTSSAGGHTHIITLSTAGNGEAFSILSPYVVKYAWERIG